MSSHKVSKNFLIVYKIERDKICVISGEMTYNYTC